MKRAIPAIILLLALSVMTIAGTVDKTSLINAPAQSRNADFYAQPKLDSAIPLPLELTDDPMQVGTTWYDWGNYGSLTKLIVLDNAGYPQMAWTNGLNLGSSQRHVYYSYYDMLSGTFPLPGGVNVISSAKSGFNCIDALSSGQALVCAHAQVTGAPDYQTIVARDYFPRVGAFDPRSITATTGHDTLIWPHMAVDINDNVYVFAREMGGGDAHSLVHHSFSGDSGSSYDQYQFADSISVPSFTVATSRISEKVAYGYHQFLGNYQDPGLWTGFLALQLNNDAMCVIKENSTDEWDFNNPINITDVITADQSYLPDTLQAQGDTLRAYLDIDLMFDNADVLHAMFTTRGLYEAPWDSGAPPISGLTEASLIWHWRSDTDELDVVAWGWWNCASNISTGGAGAWKSTICRPSMGIDDLGNIFCAFERYEDFEVNPDTSVGGFGNGEIYVTVSTDGGRNWAEPTNITNTHSNGAAAGACYSECFPSLAETVDDYLHIFYMEDKDAGSYVFDTSTLSTENPVWYEKILASEIPTTPLITQIDFHIRSGVEDVPKISLSEFSLNGNFPNPFNNSTNIEFSLKKEMPITLQIFDINGRLVGNLASGMHASGEHTVSWDAQGVSSGIYFAKLSAGDQIKTSKLVLLK